MTIRPTKPKRTPRTKRKAGAPTKAQVAELDNLHSMVQEMASMNLTIPDIAAIIGVESATIVARYSHEIETGRAHLRQLLSRKQLELALNGSEKMLIHLGKHILNQRDSITVNHNEGDFIMDSLDTDVLLKIIQKPQSTPIEIEHNPDEDNSK